jgi:leucyl-tRNA synthetase
MKTTYDHKTIEEKWLEEWAGTALFQGTTASQTDSTKEKMYLLFAFAYPSGSGLHVGHVESKTALDILARFYRMRGKEVFFPVGWDAFGLPAENYAVKTGVHPAKTTSLAIDTFGAQVKRLAISYDWTTEIATCHPEYYRWTQWLFLQLFKKGLAYKASGKVNWCPSCQTVLANEQVVNGRCERCETEVIQKDLEQWYFKITQYADELESGLAQVDWPVPTKTQQLNWIGKKKGVLVKFSIFNFQFSNAIECFTTRIDTVFGVTFVVISPELAQAWMNQGWEAPQKVQEYVTQAFHKTEEQRRIGEKMKTGVDTGVTIVNPVNNKAVPVWVADYVLNEYGTGAVMGVPAHDERDLAFATKFGLPVIEVIDGGIGSTVYGLLIHSDRYNGQSSEEAMARIPEDFPEAMKKTTTYKLRDWLISRQRYWGAPIPIVYDPEGKAHTVKEEHLPWLIPTDVEFKPTGESPLTYSQEFKERVERLYGPGWRPEYDTMDTFVDSSWYYLRYTDARNKEAFANKEKLKQWMPVDFYMIGPEHIVLHLLYSRFFTKFLRDEGYLTFDEPFLTMRHQGMILGPDHKKMSKSKGNVITPDIIIEEFGADTLRMYEMFMGPIDADKPWDPRAVAGVNRLLKRVWGLMQEEVQSTKYEESADLKRKVQETLLKLTEDIPELKFNTAIAALFVLVNAWEQQPDGLSLEDKKVVVLMIAPFAPLMAEELWCRLGGTFSVHQQVWPEPNKLLVNQKSTVVVVQVNGKVRSVLELSSSDEKSEVAVLDMVSKDERVRKWIEGKTRVKTIYIEPRNGKQGIINLLIQ